MIQLRPYQRDAIESLYSYFGEKDGNPLIVLPTGTGKSLVAAFFCMEACQQYPDTRILVLTHVRELIKGNHGELMRVWPMAPAGIYSAGLKRRDIDAQILFAGIQSIHKHAFKVQKVDLVLIDEAHLLGVSDTGMYRRFLKELRQINPYLKVIGLTATPYRMDSGMLHKGPDRLFTDIAYEARLIDMVEQGYLSPVVSKRTTTQIDVSKVGHRGGEFIASQLEAAADMVTEAAVEEIVAKGKDRGSWLLFCSGVKHAENVCAAVRRHGISCEVVSGETPAGERDAAIERFTVGKLRAIANVNVMSTGTNVPGIDLIAMLRPTESVGLYVQQLGRGMRLAEGKEDCLVLDFAGNVRRHGPVDMVDGDRDPKKGQGVPPTKVCPDCDAICHAAVRVCKSCGHEFPAPELKIVHVADTAPVLSTQLEPVWIDVDRVQYVRHEREGKSPSLRVDYYCGFLRHSEWVCLEHSGYPRQKAESWWARRARTPPPRTVADALARIEEVNRKPVAISVRPQGKYVEIVGVRFA